MTAPTVRPPSRPAPPARQAEPARASHPPRPSRPRPPRPRPLTAPDPRIVARRIAVRRDEGRRRLRRLAWAAGAATVLAAAALTTRTPVLDVDHLRVDGARRVPVAAVVAAAADAGAARGRPLLDVREASVARAVESLPGVADATVRRQWPGTVHIAITERRPVAVVAVDDAVAEVGADGVVIDVVAERPAGLPALDGVGGDLPPGAVVDAPRLLTVAAALPPAIAGQVAAIAAGDGRGTVELRLTEGGTVLLGPVEDLAAKLTAVATALVQVDRACLVTLDVRVPLAPAVTRSAGCGS